MLERFTQRARQAVVFAQSEAVRLGDHFIDTDHLVLGLAREENGIAASALRSFGLTSERLHELLRPNRVEVRPPATGQVPFTPKAVASLEQSAHEAAALGQRAVGTEHVLLGVLHSGEEATFEALARGGVDRQTLRDRVLELAGGADASP